jgi:hypothetical protein
MRYLLLADASVLITFVDRTSKLHRDSISRCIARSIDALTAASIANQSELMGSTLVIVICSPRQYLCHALHARQLCVFVTQFSTEFSAPAPKRHLQH